MPFYLCAISFNIGCLAILSNSVENGYNDDSQPTDGFGGGLYNGGDSATVLFKRLAIFKDNVGGFVSDLGRTQVVIFVFHRV